MSGTNWDAVDAAFQAAMGAPREARAALLAALCADDDALRVQVLSLLEAHDASTGFLARLARIDVLGL